GFQSWQNGCELSEDGHKHGSYQNACDGEDIISLDQRSCTWTRDEIHPLVPKRRWEVEPFITKSRNNILEKERMKPPQKFMMYGKDCLLKKGEERREGAKGCRCHRIGLDMWCNVPMLHKCRLDIYLSHEASCGSWGPQNALKDTVSNLSMQKQKHQRVTRWKSWAGELGISLQMLVESGATESGWGDDTRKSQRNIIYLEETCINMMQKYLPYQKEALLQTEPPVGKVTHKVVDDSLEVLICQAFGFYPKEIQATWTRDGEVCQNETLHRNVAPNSDGTYYVLLSIEIDPKERDHFQCYLEHEGLQEPLVLALKEETGERLSDYDMSHLGEMGSKYIY
ncbi:PREDICTED: major histocompatibility complex class I-related gene protein-like, partial [Thamnophis sirtalis]|uniref:Major histocompatibility complex class I-related gene protein-like n=1 Tax=Thamnophis sirtalis TaxID=35019 RepID=A0A6I9XRV2_9SAUR